MKDKAWIEQRKAYERGLFEKAKEYVAKEMKEETKDKVYRIAIGEFNWNLKKETLSPAKYKQLRDEFIAATFTRVGLADEIAYFTPEWEKEIVKRYQTFDTAQHFSKNAVKALEENFQEQLTAILSQTGETHLDPAKMRYLGNKSYMYNNIIFISFENSPASVTVRMTF